jgi:adenine-specific DNA methylase
MTDTPRLIERAFPLKQASLDSVHEKNVRHGHISTLHIWPARRPLAACRAALIATLLPDPGTPEARRELCEKIGGTVVQKVERKKMPDGRVVERIKEETEGGILHWKRETENAETLDWFRQEIRKAYGGRAPRVLDPFAGGGAIPLEAMRLGCEVTAADINPVAWFILKCTLEYPQKLAGQTHPLPEFVLGDEEFMAAFHKAHPHLPGGSRRARQTAMALEQDAGPQAAADADTPPEADLAWHVRAWGRWVLARARRELARFYPTYADFEARRPGKVYERQPMRLVPLREDGTADIDALNAEFSKDYLADKRNPRWVAKPTVAYLWARTVACKNCRATVPLLKTRWLCKKANKRVLLTMEPNAGRTGVVFGVEADVPARGGNAAQRREHDKRIGAGTMSRAGATCPCCGTIMTMEDIRLSNQAERSGFITTASIVDAPRGRQYRTPTVRELEVTAEADNALADAFEKIPYGLPAERIPREGTGASYGFPIIAHGIREWRRLFTARQLLCLGTFLGLSREARTEMQRARLDPALVDALQGYLYCAFSRLEDRNSAICTWQMNAEKIGHTFARFALPMAWDFCEVMPWADSSGGYLQAVEWVAKVSEHALDAVQRSSVPRVLNQSAMEEFESGFDIIVTDPPYYDAISYSDLMDFFYIWLRRQMARMDGSIEPKLRPELGPKWDHEKGDGELIDDITRHGGDREKSKQTYEMGMTHAFQTCYRSLTQDGRLVMVFAHKNPNAWEALVASMISSGFVVDASWPVQTERVGRMRSMSSAALSSSVWLVCKKRPPTARPGWDNKVLEEMRANIAGRLREFWDAGIRGPDFVWAATGPALEAYSRHPVVRKANDPGAAMGVGEFLAHARRMVVDYVVGQVLTGEAEGADLAAAERMDAPTAYYLLHRHDFGLEEAPSGACILYATACGLSDSALESTWDLLARSGGGGNGANGDDAEDEAADPDAEADAEPADSGSRVKLKTWAQRKHRSMGYEAPSGQPVPLIDRIHRLMHLWRAGEVLKVDEYLDEHGLRRQELFKRLLQSLIELSRKDGQSQELQTLESLSNHVQGKGARADYRQTGFAVGDEA